MHATEPHPQHPLDREMEEERVGNLREGKKIIETCGEVIEECSFRLRGNIGMILKRKF